MKAILVALFLSLAEQRPFTLDDEMKLRSIVDVKISPDGERVAYVVSTPNLGEWASRPHSASVSLGERSGQRLVDDVELFGEMSRRTAG